MNRKRLNVFIEPRHAKRVEAVASKQGVSKSSLVAAALAAYLSPDGSEPREAIVIRRLDRLSSVVERLERDQTILIECLGLFIRHHLSITTPLPEAHQEAARAQGRARFEQFVEQLARHLQRGGSLVRTVWQEVAPEASEPALNQREKDGNAV
jgi:hypothetical protein